MRAGIVPAKTLAFSSNNSGAIDQPGDRFEREPMDHRSSQQSRLMYPVANLTADAVARRSPRWCLGQNDFVTCTVPSTGFTLTPRRCLIDPSSLAFDSTGNLYVADGYSRVLFFQGPNFASQGQAALRVLGISPPTASGQPTTVYPTQYTLGAYNTNNNPIPPNGVFTIGNHLFVADTPQNRIVEYDIPAELGGGIHSLPFAWADCRVWPGRPVKPALSTWAYRSPARIRSRIHMPGRFSAPRCLSLTLETTACSASPSIPSGPIPEHPFWSASWTMIYNAPNLIVGSEVFLSGALGSASGMVVDINSNPPHLYVADPGNNRILCFSGRSQGIAGNQPDRRRYGDRPAGSENVGD